MRDGDRERVKEIFQEAIELPSEERGAFLEQACGDDQQLRGGVEALLAASGDAGPFLGSPTLGEPSPSATGVGELAEGPGSRIGRYKLLQLIGEGGFGTVFMAEQVEPVHRRVALKIIKLGMDTKEVIARFEAERQALALMEQPNIAKLLDAGATESGRPYFVMELVRGVPITRYCDSTHASTRERLELFVQVCRAIEHAHSKGIIHRDLKPSNILVTLHDGVPVPKVIDFGVAKATNQRLTERTLFTRYGEFIGTPMYMSPEQAELSGLDVDRRSDIYSLGVLLYELLTGATPYDEKVMRSVALVELLRFIREEDPPTPSARLKTLGNRLSEVAGSRGVEPNALSRLLRGDLDWIVMTAMRKDRQRRYDTAAAMAQDVERHLEGHTVRARPPSVGYRMGKLARKRKLPLAVAASLSVVFIGGWLGPWDARAAEGSEEVPTRRLIIDTDQILTAGSITGDGEHELRYNPKRRGFDLVDVRSRTVREVTTEGPDSGRAIVMRQLLSRDGARIATTMLPKDPATNVSQVFNGTASGTIELRVMDVGGRGSGRLVHSWDASDYQPRQLRPFAWSPDGSRVWIFAMRRDRSAEIGWVEAGGGFEVLKTIRWRNLTQIPSLSPDGRFIAYHDADTREGPNDLFLLATDGSGETRVEHPADDLKPLYAPDGSGVVFESHRRDGVRDLWFLPVRDGRPDGNPRVIWRDIAPFGTAWKFGANGSFFYHFAYTNWEVFTVDLDLAAQRVGIPAVLQRRNGEPNSAPAYSPDGRSLAHIRDNGKRLVLRNLADGTEREIPMPGMLRWPSVDWCPSNDVVFVTGYLSRYVLIRVDLEKNRVERVPVSDPRLAACIGDGSEIVYIQGPSNTIGRGRLVRRRLDTRTEQTLYEGFLNGYQLSRSHDGTRVAFVSSDSVKARLLVQAIDGGSAATVAVSPVHGGFGRSWDDFGGIAWQPGDQAMLVLTDTGQSGETLLRHIPIDGGPERLIDTMPRPQFEGQGFFGRFFYSLHPSGRSLAFQQHTGVVDQVWAIDNLLQFIQSGETAPLGPNIGRQ